MVVEMQEAEKQYTVLLLSAPIGSGHKLAAEALEQTLEDYPEIKVIHGSIFDFFPRFLGSTFLAVYLWILKCCPFLYKVVYSWGNSQGGSLWIRSIINRFLAYLGNDYLENIKPDAVIATHATPAGIIGYYKKEHPNLWLGAVITDFTIHRWWICDGVDTYFIADKLLCSKLDKTAKVFAYGIPVRKQFLNNNKKQCRESLGWQNNEKVCLLMGGGEGLLPMEKIIDALNVDKFKNMRFVAVTGHNEKMAASLHSKYGNVMEIYGFREDVPQLMSAADIIITKAGGLTSAEALVSELDIVIYKPLPGQEEGNAIFLQKNCGAFVANNIAELVQYVDQRYSEKLQLSEIHKKNHAHPLASQQITNYILQQLKEQYRQQG